MKTKIIIEQNNRQLYQGKTINVPVKRSAIVAKCIELFDDDDPCIIHSSFAQKHLTDSISEIFNETDQTILYVKDYLDELSFIDFSDLESITISLK